MLSRSASPTLPAGFIEPCLPTLARAVPSGERWAYELKHDGFRFIARRDGDRVRVFSRNAKDWTDKVPAIVEAMLALPAASATIDGEGVVVDERGVTDFERLRSALAGRSGSRSVFLYGFDLLHLDGEDLRRHPWEIAARVKSTPSARTLRGPVRAWSAGLPAVRAGCYGAAFKTSCGGTIDKKAIVLPHRLRRYASAWLIARARNRVGRPDLCSTNTRSTANESQARHCRRSHRRDARPRAGAAEGRSASRREAADQGRRAEGR